jgi:hypothetical protein
MQEKTEAAITSILALDPTITADSIRCALAALHGQKTINNDTINDRILTRAEVAKILNLSLPMVDVYCRSGHLERVKIGKSSRSIGIKASSVRRILEG